MPCPLFSPHATIKSTTQHEEILYRLFALLCSRDSISPTKGFLNKNLDNSKTAMWPATLAQGWLAKQTSVLMLGKSLTGLGNTCNSDSMSFPCRVTRFLVFYPIFRFKNVKYRILQNQLPTHTDKVAFVVHYSCLRLYIKAIKVFIQSFILL